MFWVGCNAQSERLFPISRSVPSVSVQLNGSTSVSSALAGKRGPEPVRPQPGCSPRPSGSDSLSFFSLGSLGRRRTSKIMFLIFRHQTISSDYLGKGQRLNQSYPVSKRLDSLTGI